MSSTRIIPLLLVMVLSSSSVVVLLSHLPTGRGQAYPPPATISIFSEDSLSNNYTNPNLAPGATFVVDIDIVNIPPIVNSSYGGINGFDITINFDGRVLTATGAGFVASNNPSCPSTDGCIFDGTNAIQLQKIFDVGSARLAIVDLGGEVDTPGILFKLLFRVTGRGYTDINIASTSQMTGPLGMKGISSIPYTASNGSFDNAQPFLLFASPASKSTLAGGSVAANVTAIANEGGPWNVTLSTTGLPSGASSTFNPPSGFTDYTSRLNITTSTSTPVNTYTVHIVGTCDACNGGLGFSLEANFTLIIAQPFSLQVLPASARVVAGGVASTNITASMGPSGADNVTLTVSGLPAGANAQFNPVSGFTPFTSSLDITTSPSTPLGMFTISVVGSCTGCNSGQNFTTQTVFTLTVNSNFTLTVSPNPIAVFQGNSTVVSVAVTSVSSGPQAVALSVTGLPSGITAKFTPISGTPSFSSALNLTASGSAAVGTYQLQVTGTSTASVVRSVSLNLTIEASDVGVKSVTVTPAVVNAPGTVDISVVVTNKGTVSESFTVTLFAVNSTGYKSTVGSKTVTNLAPGQDSTASFAWATIGFSPGTYTFRAEIPKLASEIRVGDNFLNGNTVRLNSPPTATFNISTTTPTVGVQVSFDASQSSDVDGTIASYSWNFGDGSTGSGSMVTHTYQTSGTFTVTLSVTDNDGASSGSTRTVLSNAPPTASFTVSTSSPNIGDQVSFDASQSADPDGTIASYAWDFGDGSTAASKVATHTYQSSGTYTVTLTVTDNDGATKTSTQAVTVAQASSFLTSPLGLGVIATAIIALLAIVTLAMRRRGKPRQNK